MDSKCAAAGAGCRYKSGKPSSPYGVADGPPCSTACRAASRYLHEHNRRGLECSDRKTSGVHNATACSSSRAELHRASRCFNGCATGKPQLQVKGFMRHVIWSCAGQLLGTTLRAFSDIGRRPMATHRMARWKHPKASMRSNTEPSPGTTQGHPGTP